MKSDHKDFNIKDSIERIGKIIATQDDAYEETDHIPSFGALTYTNGFYTKCSAICVETHKSSELANNTKNKLLTKQFRTLISEIIAIMNGNSKCAEIKVIEGTVLGIFDTPEQEDVDEVLSIGGRISTIVDIINDKFKTFNIPEISVGIGISYGDALVFKAGLKGCDVNEVFWMGDTVNDAVKLATYGNKEQSDKEIMVSEIFQYNLKEENKKLLILNQSRGCYHGNIINQFMVNWYKSQ